MYKLTKSDIAYFIISVVLSLGLIGWAIYGFTLVSKDSVDYIEVNEQQNEQ